MPPYRDSPRYLLCPRCAELLESIVFGVSMCPRCEGVWLTTHTLELAFGAPRWPTGQLMWWHNELACPECTLDGTTTIMDAKLATGISLDSCPTHGLWLDRGELGRVTASGDDELAALLRRLEANINPAELSERRELWRSEQRVQKQLLGDALAAHARASEEAVRARERDTQLARERAEELARQKLRDRAAHDALVARSEAAAEAVSRLEAKVVGLRAELELRNNELTEARRVFVEVEKQLHA